MKKHLFLILLYSFSWLSAQEKFSSSQIDSTLNVLNNPNEKLNDNTDALATQLYYNSKELNYKKGQIEALLVLSQIYLYKNENYDWVISKTKEAEKIAREINDYKSAAFAKTYSAAAFLELGLLDEAKKNIEKSFFYSKLISQNENNELIYNNYKYTAQYYSILQKYDSANSYYKKAFQLATKLPKNSFLKNYCLTESSLQIAELYLNENLPQKALPFLEIASKTDDKKLQAYYLFLRAKQEYLLQNFAQSQALYKKADSLSDVIKYPSLRAKVYLNLANLYKDKNDLENHNYYLKKRNKIKDSLNESLRSQINKIDFSENQQDKDFNDYLLYILPLPIAFIFLYLFFKRKKVRVTQIHSFEDKKPASEPAKSITELTLLANENDDGFYSKFKETFPDFENKILDINPSIKSLDLELCAFIKLNLSTKQIATIKNTSVRAIEGRKYRIRKALYITPEENMYLWISKL